MVLQINFHLLLDLAVMGALRIQPEDCRRVADASACDGELDPVADRGVFRLAHTVDVAGFHILLQQHFAVCIYGADDALCFSDKGLVVAAVFFGALGHKADVRYRAHRFRVEGAVLLAEFNGGFVDAGVAAVRNAGFDFLQLAFLVPHAAGVADHRGH